MVKYSSKTHKGITVRVSNTTDKNGFYYATATNILPVVVERSKVKSMALDKVKKEINKILNKK